MTKFKRCLSAFLALTMVFGMFSGMGGVFAPEAAAASVPTVKSFDELAAAYDQFIYVANEVYELDTNTLTDGKVKPGQWLEYRMYIKSDMWVGSNYPIFFYDKRFFDVRVITSTTAATTAAYEANKETKLYNTEHPTTAGKGFWNNLTSAPCAGITVYTNGTCELDEIADFDVNNYDQVKPNANGDTTINNDAFDMTSDIWYVNWYVKVQDEPTIDTTTVYSPASIWRNVERKVGTTLMGDSRRQADVAVNLTGGCPTETTTAPRRTTCKTLSTATVYNKVDLHLEDTYMTFELEKEVAPVEGESVVKSFAELAAAYDQFIYVANDVYELEVDPATGEITNNYGLTDGYVKAGQWLEYRMYIKSDMWVGSNYPIFFYDKRFFDVRVITSTTAATTAAYEANKETKLYNTEHPTTAGKGFWNNLTSAPCAGITVYTNGTCELDEIAGFDVNNYDQVKPNANGDTTINNDAFDMTSDIWYVNWYVKVQDAPTITETIVYSPASIWRNVERKVGTTLMGDSRRQADVAVNLTGGCPTEATTAPRRTTCKTLSTATIYNKVDLHLEDTYMTFHLGNPPEAGSEHNATFIVDSETVLEGAYAEGAEITLPETPVKEGFKFLGWSTDGETVLETPLVMGSADVTYIAVFEEIVKYTATFVVDGVTVSAEQYAEGETIVAPADPSKPGYDFTGWSGYTAGDVMGAANATFTATWSTITYDVVFYKDAAGAEYYTTTSAVYNGSYNLPTPPTKFGYEFAGWKDANGNAMPATHTLTTAVSYYASWTEGTFNATFDAKGGSWDNGDETRNVPTVFGAAIVAPQAPTRLGYVFAGWAPEVGTMDAEGKTFEALWTAKSISVHFMDGDEEIQAKPGEYGTTITAINNPTKDGYTFAGWKYEDGSVPTWPITLGAEDVYVYAQWNAKSYWITFYGETSADYIAGADGEQRCGDPIVTPAAPEKTGYRHIGWVDAQGNAMPETVPAIENQEYFAKYEAITYTATFVDGEEEVGKYEGIYESTIVAPEDPEKLGHEFAGWEGYTVGDTMPAENVTFTAKWNAKTYKVNYYVDNVLVHFDDVKFGETIPAYTYVPEDAGLNFNGWGDADPAGTIMGAEDVNVYASTGVNTFYVTFTVNGDEVDTLPFAYGAPIVAPAYDVPEGHTFETWDLSAYPTMPAENITIDATLTANTYYAYFYKFEGDAEPYATVPTVYGQAVEYPAPPEIPGYYFDGWDQEGYVMGAEDVEIYALTTQIMVYYEFLDKEGNPIDDGEIAWGEAIETAPQAPSVTGWDFAGWYVDDAKIEFPYTVQVDGTDLIIEAKYIIQGYKVTYYVDGVASGLPEAYEYGAAIAIRADEAKTGYTFSGWTAKNAEGDEIEFPATMPNYDINVYGTFTVNKYDAIFVGENGWSETVETDYNAVPAAPEAPEKAGYAFVGWEAEDGTVYTADALPAMGTADVTYTAKYSAGASTYTVKTYTMAIGGGYGEPVVATESFETDGTVTINPVAAEGFTLDAEASKLSGVVTADNALVLEVYFIRNQYTFKTIADGNEIPVEYYYGEAVVAPATPVKEGYSFTGWDGSVPETMPAENVTLTASFKINQYVITYDTVGGTPIAAVKNDYNTAIKAPADPTKTGYTFAGWVWTNTDTGATVEAPAAIPAYNATATAQWNINQYTITFVDTGDVAYEPITEDYATVLDAIATPVKTGYSFDAWVWTNTDTGAAVAAPTAIPAYNVTATATWTINQYDAIFDVDGVKTTVATDYAAVPVFADPTKPGHAFAGWKAEDGSIYAAAELPAMGTVAVTYTAEWTALPYDAIFDANGGAWADGATTITVEDVIFGTAITAPAENPTRDGYIFKEWTPAVGTMDAEGMTFTAVWTNDLTFCRVQKVERTSNLYEHGQRAFYVITVQGSPAKVQVAHNVEGGTSWTFDRGTGAAEDYVTGNLTESGLVAIKAFNADKVEVPFNDPSTSYEEWTMVTILTEGAYKVRAKVDNASWEALESAFDYTVAYDKKPAEEQKIMVTSAKPAVNSIVRGGYANVTFVTDDSVNRLRIIKDDGDGTSTIMSYSPTATAVVAYTVDADAGTATWVVNIRFTYTGTADKDAQNWAVWYRSTEGGSGWEQSDVDFNVTVTKYAETVSPSESYEAFSIVSVAGPDGATAVKGQLTPVTIVTTSDVTRVRLNDMNGRTATYLKTSNNVEYTVDEAAGTATWVISYRFSKAGEQTWGVQCRGNAWSDIDDNTFTLTVN